MDTLRTGRTEDTARGENEPLAAKPGEKPGLAPLLRKDFWIGRGLGDDENPPRRSSGPARVVSGREDSFWSPIRNPNRPTSLRQRLRRGAHQTGSLRSKPVYPAEAGTRNGFRIDKSTSRTTL